MAVTVGLLPVTGQTLPFISKGGTSMLFTGLAMGIILSVSRGELEEKEI
jgi:cell division protein FtsW